MIKFKQQLQYLQYFYETQPDNFTGTFDKKNNPKLTKASDLINGTLTDLESWKTQNNIDLQKIGLNSLLQGIDIDKSDESNKKYSYIDYVSATRPKNKPVVAVGKVTAILGAVGATVGGLTGAAAGVALAVAVAAPTIALCITPGGAIVVAIIFIGLAAVFGSAGGLAGAVTAGGVIGAGAYLGAKVMDETRKGLQQILKGKDIDYVNAATQVYLIAYSQIGDDCKAIQERLLNANTEDLEKIEISDKEREDLVKLLDDPTQQSIEKTNNSSIKQGKTTPKEENNNIIKYLFPLIAFIEESKIFTIKQEKSSFFASKKSNPNISNPGILIMDGLNDASKKIIEQYQENVAKIQNLYGFVGYMDKTQKKNPGFFTRNASAFSGYVSKKFGQFKNIFTSSTKTSGAVSPVPALK